MAALTFDAARFRATAPAFTAIPDGTLAVWWDIAAMYVSADDYGWLSGAARAHAIDLMLAHLLTTTPAVTSLVSQGSKGVLLGATIDKVQVQFAAPPTPDKWSYFLSQSAYGQALLALLEAAGVGGLYVGGLPERAALRRVGGLY